MTSSPLIRLPAEWEPQSGIQLTWPHADTDWKDILDDVIPCFVAIAQAIARRERLLIAAPNVEEVKRQLGPIADIHNVRFCTVASNDTWARDHAPISVFEDGKPSLYDFTFNGWGMKFAADLDNRITRRLFGSGVFQPQVAYHNMLRLVLEGGSIESDGAGTLLTTEACLLSHNRNDDYSREKLEEDLCRAFGVSRILWLRNGYLAGDDTDSHIDTLARFCSADTIAYVACDDPTDEHYEALRAMEAELRDFRTASGAPYRLVALPMADAAFEEDGHRLPATYANFLIVNGAVLMPTYGSAKDAVAAARLGTAFPKREIIGIDCAPLIRQHGSLHCVTMQYPEGFLK